MLNRVEPYRFLAVLKSLKSVKGKKEARTIDAKWSECCAAKVLDNPPDFFTFVYYKFFNYKVKRSIYALVDHVSKNYPQLIGSGLNLYSFAWWHKKFQKYKNKDDLHRSLRIFFVLFLMMSAGHLKNKSQNSWSVQGTKHSSDNVQKSTVRHNTSDPFDTITNEASSRLSKSLGLDELNGKSLNNES